MYKLTTENLQRARIALEMAETHLRAAHDREVEQTAVWQIHITLCATLDAIDNIDALSRL